MKKLILSILFILCLSFQAVAWNIMVVGSGTSETVVDGEIGDSTAETNWGAAVINYYYFYNWVPTTAGNVQYLRAKGYDEDNSGTSNVCLTLWDSGGSPLGSCTVAYTTSARAWKYCDMGSPVLLVDATTYYLSFSEVDGDAGFSYGSTATATDYDNWGGAINCGVDDGLTDDGSIGTVKLILLHADNTAQDNP